MNVTIINDKLKHIIILCTVIEVYILSNFISLIYIAQKITIFKNKTKV